MILMDVLIIIQFNGSDKNYDSLMNFIKETKCTLKYNTN